MPRALSVTSSPIAVAAGREAGQPTLVVASGTGDAVELDRRSHRLAREACQERLDLVVGVGLVQGKHRMLVTDRGEQRRDAVGDLLGRGVRALQLRMVGLQAEQLVPERVELRVGDLRLARVIEKTVAADELFQLAHPLLSRRRLIGRGHARNVRPRCVIIRASLARYSSQEVVSSYSRRTSPFR